MSKIGNKKILIPKEVNISINEGNLDIKGPNGNKKIYLDTKLFEVNIGKNNELSLKPMSESSVFKLFEIEVNSETKVVTLSNAPPPVISVILSSLYIGRSSEIFDKTDELHVTVGVVV